MFTQLQPTDLLAIIPEIGLTLLAILVLAVDLATGRKSKRNLGFLTAGGAVVIMVLLLSFGYPDEATSAFGGMVRHDMAAVVFQTIFLVATAITALLSLDSKGLKSGEYYAVLLVSTLGMSLMASAANLVMFYVALETTSISAYILVGYLQHDNKSTESGLKYFLFGAFASAILLYGFSLMYGYTGTTDIYQIADLFFFGVAPASAISVATVLIVVGMGFKIAAVPFHFWTPDVYEGAPTPITAFVSVASKSAGFALMLRFFLAGTAGQVHPSNAWVPLLTAMSVGTMTLGNLFAIWQTNIKRFLAYSSVAHAGYALMGVVAFMPRGLAAAGPEGAGATIFYLAAYTLTNLSAFAIVILFANLTGSDEIKDYAGLSRRSPYLAFAMLLALLSLAGIPPLAGFFGKFFLFRAAIEANMTGLAIIGVLNAIVGLYYYLMLVRVIYLFRAEPEVEAITIPVPRSSAFALGITMLGVIALGIYATPMFEWAMRAAESLF
ncbi:MAG: NADH-quinone oxidoreductase subunit N [Chloroflexota bacterium]